MSESADPQRWLAALSDAAGSAPEVDPASVEAQIAHVLHRQRQRQRGRRAVMVGGALLAAAAVAVVWARVDAVGVANQPRHERFQAESVSTMPSREASATTREPRRPTSRTTQSIVDAPGVQPEASVPTVGPEPAPRRPTKQRVRLSADELLARARRARADKDLDGARTALLALRKRFPRSSAAEQATFLIGRVELELAQRPDAALAWFERYVSEYPDGRFSPQARGRVIHYRSSHGSRARARDAAADYLAHHRAGPYADIARAVLDAGP